MGTKILAVLEQREGKLKKSSFEVVGFVTKLAKELNIDTEAVVVGNNVDNLKDISKYGIKKVVHFKNEKLKNYSSSAYSEIVANYAQEIGAKFIILSNTSLGKDLAPRISVKYDAGCIMDCVNYWLENDDIIATRPVYAGKALVDVKF
ncbi:MAG TPA: electron transfer flavoprotein subunit alpha/FixB family protein, partial [Ignavibacteria bacterium]|nr:electron transfer flavoprotein subunit alpha/FixB family protein [Ignavibacteria bacterium]